MLHLSTAALICCAYLSGMRPEEVLALRRGCCTRVERDDDTVRFEIRGRHFKGVLDEDGNTIGEGEQRADPWIVLEPVARAIAVVEELEDGEQLFTRTLYRYAKGTCMPRTGLSSDTAVERIRAFTAWANQLAAAHHRPHELIPDDPDGAVALRRFRCTVAWFIYRQPGGRIALAVQYGHAATAMSESYAGRSKTDMLEVLDKEKGLALAETLTEAGERLAAGEKVSGPAADRYRAAATEFSDRYAGTYLGKRVHRAVRPGPRPGARRRPQHSGPLPLPVGVREHQPHRQPDHRSADRDRTDRRRRRGRSRPLPHRGPRAAAQGPPRRHHPPPRRPAAGCSRPRGPPMSTSGGAGPDPGCGAALARLVGEALTRAQEHAGTEDAEEVRAITDAMVRLLIGAPLHSDGKLTVVSLATEAGLRRNKLTHKHTGLKTCSTPWSRPAPPSPTCCPTRRGPARSSSSRTWPASVPNATTCADKHSSWPGSSTSWRSRTASSRRPTRPWSSRWPPTPQSPTSPAAGADPDRGVNAERRHPPGCRRSRVPRVLRADSPGPDQETGPGVEIHVSRISMTSNCLSEGSSPKKRASPYACCLASMACSSVAARKATQAAVHQGSSGATKRWSVPWSKHHAYVVEDKVGISPPE